MGRLALGTLVAAVAVFFWGFLYWATNPFPYRAWHQVADDRAAGEALRAHFTKQGTYFVPSMAHPTEEIEALSKAGPVAMIHVLPGGRPLMEPGRMAAGFVLGWLTSVVMAVALWCFRRSLPTWSSRVLAAALVGLVGVVLVDGGEAVWWFASPSWVLAKGAYNLGACLISGAVLGLFLPREVQV